MNENLAEQLEIIRANTIRTYVDLDYRPSSAKRGDPAAYFGFARAHPSENLAADVSRFFAADTPELEKPAIVESVELSGLAEDIARFFGWTKQESPL